MAIVKHTDGNIGRLWAECMRDMVSSDPARRRYMTKDKLRIVLHFWNNAHPLVINDNPEVIGILIDKYRVSEHVRHLDCEEAEAEMVRRALDD